MECTMYGEIHEEGVMIIKGNKGKYDMHDQAKTSWKAFKEESQIMNMVNES